MRAPPQALSMPESRVSGRSAASIDAAGHGAILSWMMTVPEELSPTQTIPYDPTALRGTPRRRISIHPPHVRHISLTRRSSASNVDSFLWRSIATPPRRPHVPWSASCRCPQGQWLEAPKTGTVGTVAAEHVDGFSPIDTALNAIRDLTAAGTSPAARRRTTVGR
jgi:hypothetical protein